MGITLFLVITLSVLLLSLKWISLDIQFDYTREKELLMWYTLKGARKYKKIW